MITAWKTIFVYEIKFFRIDCSFFILFLMRKLFIEFFLFTNSSKQIIEFSERSALGGNLLFLRLGLVTKKRLITDPSKIEQICAVNCKFCVYRHIFTSTKYYSFFFLRKLIVDSQLYRNSQINIHNPCLSIGLKIQ